MYCGISLNLDKDLLESAMPLLANADVEAIEWSWDALYRFKKLPAWFSELLVAFGQAGRLVGHGVFYSLFSGRISQLQKNWLQHVHDCTKEYVFAHVTEHFGFMTGESFHAGAPLSVPFTELTKKIAINRLQWLSYHAQVPIGLENLAFSYGRKDVINHGKFLQEILEPVNGFMILDLHNMYCQTINFNLSFEELIDLHPLHLVREIHLSGGSWEEEGSEPKIKIRRDTHDDRVPEDVFQYLEKVLPKCPHLKFIFLEQLGIGLKTEKQREGFRNDFYRMKKIVSELDINQSSNDLDFLPDAFRKPDYYIESEELYSQQSILSTILETAESKDELHIRLSESALQNTAWEVESWDHTMIETAWKISRKWKA